MFVSEKNQLSYLMEQWFQFCKKNFLYQRIGKLDIAFAHSGEYTRVFVDVLGIAYVDT